MPSYETLDAIADAYVPSLAFITLAFLLMSLMKFQWRLAGLKLVAFISVALVAYGLMFFDNQYNIWPAFGLDYSTHTALALGLVAALSFNLPKLTVLWVVSFVGYILLMLYQGYHTLTDILTTGFVIGILIVPVMICLHRYRRRNGSEQSA